MIHLFVPSRVIAMCFVIVKMFPIIIFHLSMGSTTCPEDLLTTIELASSKQNLLQVGDRSFDLPYGGDLTLYCASADHQNLTIQNEETTKINNNTIQLNVNNPNAGQYKYICEDKQTGCEDYVAVRVIPGLTVNSVNIRETQDAYGRRIYFVPLGEPYEVFCSSDKTDELDMYFTEGPKSKHLKMQAINSTTVKAKMEANFTVERSFYCSKLKGIEPTTLIVDYYPKAEDFECLLQSRKLECSWRSNTKRNTFRLFLLQNGETILLCTDNYREAKRGCTANMPVSRYNILNRYKIDSVIMEACNGIFCDSQTIPFDRDSIVKLSRPGDLKILNISSNSVAISWKSPKGVFFWDCLFKVDYRLLSTEWQQANTSSVQCNITTCQYQLALPCPNSHYELKVQAKGKLAQEKFWSEPATLYFFTDRQSEMGSEASTVVEASDPICNVEFEEAEPLPSIEVVLFKTRELIRHERKEEFMVKKRISVLKQKLLRIRELERLIANSSGDMSG